MSKATRPGKRAFLGSGPSGQGGKSWESGNRQRKEAWLGKGIWLWIGALDSIRRPVGKAVHAGKGVLSGKGHVAGEGAWWVKGN